MRPSLPFSLCIVIPTLNEEAALPQTLRAARLACPDAAIAISDGRSDDGTVRVAESFGAMVVVGPRGRGRQLNAGAETAVARNAVVLLFLHADTLLPMGAQDAILTAVADEQIVGGNFTLAFSPDDFLNRLFARIYNARSRSSARNYYGDSAMFVRRSAFDALDGFRETMSLMEDWEFARRLEETAISNSQRTTLLPLVVQTSARRFTGRRRMRYIGIWLYLHYLHARGVGGDELARLYPEAR